MIFSTQMMDTAFRYFGKSFHKIIAVNFKEDKFQPIKVDNEEWEAINGKNIDFSDWLTNFCENDCHPNDIWVHAKIMEDWSYANDHEAVTYYYRRRYEDKWHYTALSVVPGYDDWCFIFVKVLEEAEE